MSDDRDLAEAIYDAIISDASVIEALDIWHHPITGASERRRMWFALQAVADHAIAPVLARRQREAARTGPWDGGHHFQEEDGYPGSLLLPKRDAP